MTDPVMPPQTHRYDPITGELLAPQPSIMEPASHIDFHTGKSLDGRDPRVDTRDPRYVPRYDPNTGVLLNPLPEKRLPPEAPLTDDELRWLRQNVLV